MKRKKILITGINGFIGKSLAMYFTKKGIGVYGLSRKHQSNNIYPVYSVVYYTPKNISKIISRHKPNIVIHCAGSSSVEKSIINPAEDFSSSVLLFHLLLEGVRKSKERPIILFPSSAAVYGNQDKYPIAETADLKPISPYGYHKAICEMLAKEYVFCYDMRIVILRLFSLFGERQKRLLIWDLYNQFETKPIVVVKGSGREIRDYLYIDDLGEILIKLLPKIKNNYEIYNIASGYSISVKKLADLIKKQLKSKKNVHFANKKRAGHPLIWKADVSKLNNYLNKNESYDFKEKLAYLLKQWKI